MYPPKVHQFAYVTDEACTEDEILSMEIIVMKVKNTEHFTHWSHGTSVWTGLHSSKSYIPNLTPLMGVW